MGTTRTKFQIEEITMYTDTSDNPVNKVILIPVIDREENKSFSRFTPRGKIELLITNMECEIGLGEFYYVDFTRIE